MTIGLMPALDTMDANQSLIEGLFGNLKGLVMDEESDAHGFLQALAAESDALTLDVTPISVTPEKSSFVENVTQGSERFVSVRGDDALSFANEEAIAASISQEFTTLPITVDMEALKELLPQTSYVLASDGEKEVLENVIMNLQNMEEGALRATLQRIEMMASTSPEALTSAFQSDGKSLEETVSQAMKALGITETSQQLTALNEEVKSDLAQKNRQAFMAEFSDIKGKIFRIEKSEAKNISAVEASRMHSAMLESQESLAPTRTLQENLDRDFQQQADVKVDVTEKSTVAKDSDFKVMAQDSQKGSGIQSTQDSKSQDIQGIKVDSTLNVEKNEIRTSAPIPQQVTAKLQEHVRTAQFTTPSSEKISIQLTPESLGRIEIQMEIDKQGGVKIVVAADKLESLQALRQEVQSLEKSFNGAGFSASADDFQFEHRQGQSNQQQTHFTVHETSGRDEELNLAPHLTSYQMVSNDRIDVQV